MPSLAAPPYLTALIATEGAARTRAAVILAWAKQQRLSPAALAPYPCLEELLSASSGDSALADSLAKSDTPISLKQIEGVFESAMDQQRKQAQGAVYTPNFIIDDLIQNSWRLAHPSDAPTFCDPACGSGGFLVRATEYFAQHLGVPPAEALSQRIRGLDNDPWAITHAQALLSIRLLQQGVVDPVAVQQAVHLCDTLLTEPEEIKRQIGIPNGIDVVATNPPYVKLQNLPGEYRAALMDRYQPFISGTYSLALLFLIAGPRLLSPGGALGYITQNNLYTSLAGKPVRAHLQSQQSLRRIVDFSHAKLFPGASAYTCLVFLSAASSTQFEYERLSGEVTEASLQSAEFDTIPTASLNAGKWRLAKQPHRANLDRIENIGPTLGKRAKINVGFATLKDAVFHLSGEVDHANSVFQTTAGDLIELDATVRAVKVPQLETERDVVDNQRRVIFPYERLDGKWALIAEPTFATRYPRGYAYLTKHRDALAARDKGKKQYPAWYAWARTQGRDAPGPKLLTKTFSRQPGFFRDDSDQLFCNGYAVASPQGISLECLQRILNSRVMHYYAKLTSFQIGGDYQCYQKNFIERFGIPQLSAEQSAQLAACEESQVDHLVAQFYGLEPAAIDEIVGDGF